MTILFAILSIIAAIALWKFSIRKKATEIKSVIVPAVTVAPKPQRKRYPHLSGNSHQRRVQRRANIRKGEQ